MDAVIPSPNRFHTIRTDFGRRTPASGQGTYGYDHFGLDFGGAFRGGISENAAWEKSNDCIATTPQRAGIALARVCGRILPRTRSGRRGRRSGDDAGDAGGGDLLELALQLPGRVAGEVEGRRRLRSGRRQRRKPMTKAERVAKLEEFRDNLLAAMEKMAGDLEVYRTRFSGHKSVVMRRPSSTRYSKRCVRRWDCASRSSRSATPRCSA